eukprot:768484-Hanusia_phi.AAC.1
MIPDAVDGSQPKSQGWTPWKPVNPGGHLTLQRLMLMLFCPLVLLPMGQEEQAEVGGDEAVGVRAGFAVEAGAGVSDRVELSVGAGGAGAGVEEGEDRGAGQRELARDAALAGRLPLTRVVSRQTVDADSGAEAEVAARAGRAGDAGGGGGDGGDRAWLAHVASGGALEGGVEALGAGGAGGGSVRCRVRSSRTLDAGVRILGEGDVHRLRLAIGAWRAREADSRSCNGHEVSADALGAGRAAVEVGVLALLADGAGGGGRRTGESSLGEDVRGGRGKKTSEEREEDVRGRGKK